MNTRINKPLAQTDWGDSAVILMSFTDRGFEVIQKFPPDKEEYKYENISSLSKKIKEQEIGDTQVTLITSFENFTVKDFEGKDQPIMKYMDPQKKYHLLMPLRPFFDCTYYSLIGPVREFCEENPEVDYYIIVSHEYKEELLNSRGFLEMEGPVIYNLEPERVVPFYVYHQWYPESMVVLIDNKGKVIRLQEERIDEFFKKIDNIIQE